MGKETGGKLERVDDGTCRTSTNARSERENIRWMLKRYQNGDEKKSGWSCGMVLGAGEGCDRSEPFTLPYMALGMWWVRKIAKPANSQPNNKG